MEYAGAAAADVDAEAGAVAVTVTSVSTMTISTTSYPLVIHLVEMSLSKVADDEIDGAAVVVGAAEALLSFDEE